MSKTFKIFLFFYLFISTAVKSQEINFGTYYNYTASLIELNPLSDLDFGDIYTSQGLVILELSEAKILALEGVKYLDVIVTVTADNNLINTDVGCTGNCTIPFTLEAAYANLGAENIGQVTTMPVIANVANAQFTILRRANGAPGPPPTPVYEGYDPTIFNETAYIYIYGSVTVGLVNAGTYASNITVSVSYD